MESLKQKTGWLSATLNIQDKNAVRQKRKRKGKAKHNKNIENITSSTAAESTFDNDVTLLDTSNFRQTNISIYLKRKQKDSLKEKRGSNKTFPKTFPKKNEMLSEGKFFRSTLTQK